MPVSKTASNKKTSKAPKTSVKEVASVEKKTVQKAGGKTKALKDSKAKSVAPKTQKAKVTKVEAEVTTTAEGEKSVRSFKVMLPGTDNFVGRFTGLTPYQAANKALSKYYRETKKPKSDIQFSIRESTRGSKRSTYTYNGARVKLDEPVKYTISNNGEDREIVKKFKNRLTKVKKSELSA